MTLAATLGTIPAPTLSRVRRAAPPTPAFNKPDPYSLLMDCWVSFMHTNDRDLGSRGMKLQGEGCEERVDPHEAQRLADIRTGETVNAMVDSLSIQHRWAICKSRGISRGWRFPNANYEEVLSDARDELEKKLRNNVATRLYFS